MFFGFFYISIELKVWLFYRYLSVAASSYSFEWKKQTDLHKLLFGTGVNNESSVYTTNYKISVVHVPVTSIEHGQNLSLL